MTLAELTSREAVLRAVREYDDLGADEFLARHGFGPSRRYVLVFEGRSYDSKAIVGVAHGYQHAAVGPLPSSAFSGGLGGAAGRLRGLGFEVVDGHPLVSGEGVGARVDPQESVPTPVGTRRDQTGMRPTVILVGCVKGKRTVAGPARDLYTSDLFRKRRAYAEAHDCPWFILSAQHGLVAPDETLAPYDMALKDQGAAYRRDWGQGVVRAIGAALPTLVGEVIEIHAGAAYVDAIRPGLAASGASVHAPLQGLRQGEQLAWYLKLASGAVPSPVASVEAVGSAVEALANELTLRSPVGFPWGRPDLGSAGLYSWWVDESGAATMSQALGSLIRAGLVYAGQAGATSWPSGKRSDATLRLRVGGNHLQGRITSSSWRLTLGSILKEPLELLVENRTLTEASDRRLTSWMQEHLRINLHPVGDRDSLGSLEEHSLAALDPPLNLAGMVGTPIRQAVSQLRRDLLTDAVDQ